MTESWKQVVINPDASLRQALQVIDASAMQIALVVNPDNRLLGTITDGDIRRALLRGDDMDITVDKIMNPNP